MFQISGFLTSTEQLLTPKMMRRCCYHQTTANYQVVEQKKVKITHFKKILKKLEVSQKKE